MDSKNKNTIMLYETIKSNLNKIDFELKELYDDVKISEKTTHNKFYFQIEATGNFENLLESNQNRKVKSLVLIEKSNLNFDTVDWSYCVNPEDVESDFIVRSSKIDELAKDIYNTVTKKQMDLNYLKLTPIDYEIINENVNENVEVISVEDEILDIVEKFNIEIFDALVENLNGRKSLKIYHNGIKVSDKFKLESKINDLESVSFVSFVDDFIKINLNN